MRHAICLLSFTLLTLSTATLAQTCNPAISADAPDSRYQTATNGTVLDKQTGLVWKRCAEGQSWQDGQCKRSPAAFSWLNALAIAEAATFAGKTDWRLPNQKELQSLVEHRCVAPAINLTVFPNAGSGWFWSSSPNAGYRYGAWLVDFNHGYNPGDDKVGSYAVRLVRAGQ